MPERIFRRVEVKRFYGNPSNSTFYDRMKRGQIPAPRRRARSANTGVDRRVDRARPSRETRGWARSRRAIHQNPHRRHRREVSTKASAGAGDSGDRRDLISAELNPANIEIAAKTQAPPGAARPLDAIIVGDRHHRDLGDIAGLATSIAKIGLLNPIIVNENGRLLAGARRLRQRPLRGQR